MEKHIIKNSEIEKDDITHIDQEIKGLQFSCFHISDSRVIFTVNGDEAIIDEWSSRFGKDVSEMTASEYNALTETEVKDSLIFEIAELDKTIKDKNGKLTEMG